MLERFPHEEHTCRKGFFDVLGEEEGGYQSMKIRQIMKLNFPGLSPTGTGKVQVVLKLEQKKTAL